MQDRSRTYWGEIQNFRGGEGDVDGGEGDVGGAAGEDEVLTGGASDGGDTGANVTAAGVVAVDCMFGVAGLIAPMSNMPPRMNIKKMAIKKRNRPALCLLLAR
jgi:hypothetical protein